MMGVDHQRRLCQRTEVERRSCDLPTDAGQLLQPGKTLRHGAGCKMVETRPTITGCDRRKRPLQARRLGLSVVNRSNQAVDLLEWRVAYRRPVVEAQHQPLEGGLGDCASCAPTQ